MVATMMEQKLDYSGTVCIMQPPAKLRDKQDEDATTENAQRQVLRAKLSSPFGGSQQASKNG